MAGASVAKVFSQKYLVSLDGKNRASLPAAFRDVITRRTGEKCTSVVLDAHPQLQCLRGYAPDYLDDLQNGLDTRFGIGISLEKEQAGAELFSSIEECGLDEGGRFVVSEVFRRHIGAKKDLLFQGVGGSFLIWHPQTAVEQFDPNGQIKQFLDTHSSRRTPS